MILFVIGFCTLSTKMVAAHNTVKLGDVLEVLKCLRS